MQTFDILASFLRNFRRSSRSTVAARLIHRHRVDPQKELCRLRLEKKAAGMSYYKAYAVAIASLLTGAAVVHNIYKPDLVSSQPRALVVSDLASQSCVVAVSRPNTSA